MASQVDLAPQPPVLRRDSSADVKRRVTERSIARKDVRSAGVDHKKREFEAQLAEARKVPLDLLASEWLDDIDAPIEVRAYLVEKLLPTLVLGIEKLLREVQIKDAIDQPERINPINYIAQYLMRNNPRYSNFAEASPYNRSMRVVLQELKDRAYELSGNRLAKLAADVERRRRLVEEEEIRKMHEWTKHLQPVLSRFPEWDDSGLGLYAPALVTCLQSFYASNKRSEHISKLPDYVVAAIKFEDLTQIQANDAVPVSQQFLCRQIGSALEDAPDEVVKLLAVHMHATFGHESFSVLAFQSLFDEIPIAPERQRFVLLLLEFYEAMKEETEEVELYRPRASGTASPHPNSSGDDLLLNLLRKSAPVPKRKARNLTFPFGRQPSPAVFDHSAITRAEFVELLNELVGANPTENTVHKLVSFVRVAIQETPEQKATRLAQEAAKKERVALQNVISDVFDKWDNDCSGFLEFSEISSVFRLWKNSTEEEGNKLAAEALEFVGASVPDGRMNKSSFTLFMLELLLPRETHDDKSKRNAVIESLMACLNYSFLEEARGQMRKRWIKDIKNVDASAASVTDFLPTIHKAFEILEEDNRLYGSEGAIISACVAEASGNGKEIFNLHFIAATPGDEAVVGQNLAWTDADAASFSAVNGGLPVHVTSIYKHGHVKLFRERTVTPVWWPQFGKNIFMYLYETCCIRLKIAFRFTDFFYIQVDETDGSMLICPLRDKQNFTTKNGILGVFVVDTLAGQNCAHFERHQLSFYQGIASILSASLKRTRDALEFARVVQLSNDWLRKHDIEFRSTSLYFVSTSSDNLHLSLYSPELSSKNKVISRSTIGVEYLYRAVEMDQVTSSYVKPFRHTCFPIRIFGTIYALLDIITDEKLDFLCERELLRHTRILSNIARYIKEADVPVCVQPTEGFANWHEVVLEIDEYEYPTRSEVFFDRAMLLDTRVQIGKLDANTFHPLRVMTGVSPIIDKIVTSVLSLLLEPSDHALLNDWQASKQYLSTHLSRLVVQLDPTAAENVEKLLKIGEIIKDISFSSALKTRSPPVVAFFNWLRVAVMLAQHTVTFAKKKPRARVLAMSHRVLPSDIRKSPPLETNAISAPEVDAQPTSEGPIDSQSTSETATVEAPASST